MSPISSKNAMFHVVKEETKAPDLIHHTIEKSAKFLDRYLEAKFNHPMNHSRIVNINPEGKPLIPFLKGVKIEGPQSPCEVLISFKLLRTSDRPVVDCSFLRIDETGFQVSHRES